MVYGELKDGNYEYEIDVCGLTHIISLFHEIHIYSGIKELAKVLGKELRKSKRTDADWELSFGYKGYRVYQIVRDKA